MRVMMLLPTLTQFSFVGKYPQEIYSFFWIFPTMLLISCLYCPFSSLFHCNTTVLSTQPKKMIIWWLLSACLALSMSLAATWAAASSSRGILRYFFDSLHFGNSRSWLILLIPYCSCTLKCMKVNFIDRLFEQAKALWGFDFDSATSLFIQLFHCFNI